MLYQNPEKSRDCIFNNPGIGIEVQSRDPGIFRDPAGHCLALPQNHTKLNFPETIRIPLEFEIVIALSIALQNCVAKLHFIIESNLTWIDL